MLIRNTILWTTPYLFRHAVVHISALSVLGAVRCLAIQFSTLQEGGSKFSTHQQHTAVFFEHQIDFQVSNQGVPSRLRYKKTHVHSTSCMIPRALNPPTSIHVYSTV